jgi:hypothetical protein
VNSSLSSGVGLCSSLEISPDADKLLKFCSEQFALPRAFTERTAARSVGFERIVIFQQNPSFSKKQNAFATQHATASFSFVAFRLLAHFSSSFR